MCLIMEALQERVRNQKKNEKLKDSFNYNQIKWAHLIILHSGRSERF